MRYSFILLTSVLLAFVGCSGPQANSSKNEKLTPMGFYWPTGTSKLGDYGDWLGDGCKWSGKNGYFVDEYHIGKDIIAKEKDIVYAISDGVVLHRSPSGWGEGNIALLIEHKLSDGNSFTAVYGHIQSDLPIGEPVTAGKEIGKIGPYSPPHLHFGVRPGLSIVDPYGKMVCPPQGPITDVNNFVDPIEWILSKSPLSGADLAVQAAHPTETVSVAAPDHLSDDERAVKERFESKMKEKPNCEIKISAVYTQNFIGLTEADRANGIKSRNTVWIDYIVREGNDPWYNGTKYYTVENGRIDERSDPFYCK